MNTAASHALLAALKSDYRVAALDPPDRVMLDYAVHLTRAPAAIRQEDVTALHQAGFDDLAVHDICAITAYFAFVNRIADGLGVELEERFGADAGRSDDTATEML